MAFKGGQGIDRTNVCRLAYVENGSYGGRGRQMVTSRQVLRLDVDVQAAAAGGVGGGGGREVAMAGGGRRHGAGSRRRHR